MRVYFARCMDMYGTSYEAGLIRMMAELDWEVIDFPEQAEIDAWAADNGRGGIMDFFFRPLVESADIVVFHDTPDGITAGVWEELRYADNCGIPVFQLPCTSRAKVMTIEETRAWLRGRCPNGIGKAHKQSEVV